MPRKPTPAAPLPTDATPRLVPTALLRAPRGRPRPLLQVRRWLRILGPGLVTGAADDDPSGIGMYSQAGAAFGTGQLWLALYMRISARLWARTPMAGSPTVWAP
jgi:hypothetical protein